MKNFVQIYCFLQNLLRFFAKFAKKRERIAAFVELISMQVNDGQPNVKHELVHCDFGLKDGRLLVFIEGTLQRRDRNKGIPEDQALVDLILPQEQDIKPPDQSDPQTLQHFKLHQ